MEKNFLVSREEYLVAKATWKNKANPVASEMIIYNVIRGKDKKNGFCEKKKHIQGNDPWFAYNEALFRAKIFIKRLTPGQFKASFGIEPTPEILELFK
jgi:hypothetical protein